MNSELLYPGLPADAIATEPTSSTINSWLKHATAWTNAGDYDKAIAICNLIVLMCSANRESLSQAQILDALIDFQNALLSQMTARAADIHGAQNGYSKRDSN